jgi:alpha-galactosidase
MVKADYCHVPSNETGRDLYTRFSKALNATGHPMLFSLCQWGEDNISEWGGEIAQMYRIQMDHIPFWSYPPQAAGVGYGQGTKQIIEFMADLHPSRYNRPHAWMDPDFLETLFMPAGYNWPPMNFTNSRTEYSFWAIWSSPLFVATDPADLSDEKKAILMNPEVIAINQDTLFSAGERIKNENVTTGGEVWSRLLANGDVCVIFYNCGNKNAVPVSITWEELAVGKEWKNTDSIAVRDLWNRRDLGSFVSGYEAVVDAHDVLMVRLSKPDVAK